jgi:uncharacterized protein (DUF2062 family)
MFKRRERQSWVTFVGRSFWPRGGWGRAFYYVWHRLRRLPDPPHKVARGIAAGVFASFTPFFGLHFVVAGLVAWGIRGSILAAFLSTLFGNPLTFPLLATASMSAGNWVLGRGPSLPFAEITLSFGQAFGDIAHNLRAPFTPEVAHWDGLALFFNDVFLPYSVGSLITGPIGAVGAYCGWEAFVARYPIRRRR